MDKEKHPYSFLTRVLITTLVVGFSILILCGISTLKMKLHVRPKLLMNKDKN